MILDDITNLTNNDTVRVQCDRCLAIFDRTLLRVKAYRRRLNGKGSTEDCCVACARKQGASKRPQNTTEFIRAAGSSQAYYEGIKNRPSIEGENNPMWGKEHTDQTKKKMSIARTGKTGENATAWKGGKMSIVRRVKSRLQKTFKWFSRVIDRDNKECQHCGATKKLDSHHIVPISSIVKKLLANFNETFIDDSSKVEWLLEQPEILDNNLTNGIALCRPCHKQVHINWGSHNTKVRK